MKLSFYVPILALASVVALTACSSDGGGFTGVNNPGGGPGAGGGGGGGGGGPVLPELPDLARQVTPGADVLSAMLSGDARYLAYRSDENPDLGGGTFSNPSRSVQIFQLLRGPDSFDQLTTATSSNAIALGFFDMTDDGTEILFSSTQDLVGTNVTNRQNLFIARNSGQDVSQVTDNLSVETLTEWQLAGDGSYAVFGTASNLLGTNPDTDVELYRYSTDGSSRTQITFDDALPENIRLADASPRIVYTSIGDPLGTNADLNQELFVINADGTDHRQLTDTLDNATDIVAPKISDAGDRIVFASNRDFVGGNTDLTYEVFVVNANSGVITQVTDTNRDSGVFPGNLPGDVDISGDGEWVAFGSTFDFTGENLSNGHTIFWASWQGTAVEVGQLLTQDSVAAGVNSLEGENVSLNNDGSIISFNSLENFSADATGGDRKIFTQIRQ